MVTRDSSAGRASTNDSLSAVEKIRVELVVPGQQISNVFRTIFEIFLTISAALMGVLVSTPTMNNVWLLFLGFTLTLSVLFVGLSVWSSRHARSLAKPEANVRPQMMVPHKEWERAFLNWVNADRPYHPPLSDEAISRESSYREREDAQL